MRDAQGASGRRAGSKVAGLRKVTDRDGSRWMHVIATEVSRGQPATSAVSQLFCFLILLLRLVPETPFTSALPESL